MVDFPQDESGYTSGYVVQSFLVDSGRIPTLDGEVDGFALGFSYGESLDELDVTLLLDLDLASKLKAALDQALRDVNGS